MSTEPIWTDEALDEALERTKEFISVTLASAGHLMPMAVVYTTKDPHTLEPTGKLAEVLIVEGDPSWGGDPASGVPTTDEQTMAKDRFAFLVKTAAIALDAAGVLFMAEAWAVMVKNEEDSHKIAGRAHLHPDRVEIAMLSQDRYLYVEEAGQRKKVGVRQYMARAPMIREEGKPIRLGEWEGGEPPSDAVSKGRFSRFLPPVHSGISA